MALTPEQKSSRLFKKAQGVAETIIDRQFFEESKIGRSAVLPDQIWSDADQIPVPAPSLTNGQTQGVVQYLELLELTLVPGSQDKSYSHDSLRDTIPFNFQDGSYNYFLTKNDGTTQIFFGEGDWLVDTEAGVLTFYGTLPSGVNALNPPKISFYKYVGDKGLGAGGAGSGIIVKDPVIATTAAELSGATYDEGISGFTSLPFEIDGVTVFSDGDRFLVKDQVDLRQNGIYKISGTTLIRAEDHDGTPIGEVRINNYAFTTSGVTNIAKSWVLSGSDAIEPEVEIRPGIDTQTWKLFAESLTYDTNGLGLKLEGNIFSIDLDEVVAGESGLEQSVDGLKITDAVLDKVNSIDTLDGSGLTYSGGTLNVKVDDFTIKIVNDELRTPVRFNQNDKLTDIISGTTGATNIVLTFEPVDYISAYVNGVEYLVSNTAGASETDKPFYFDNFPAQQGDILYFDANEAGFGIESGIDLIMVKYHYIIMT